MDLILWSAEGKLSRASANKFAELVLYSGKFPTGNLILNRCSPGIQICSQTFQKANAPTSTLSPSKSSGTVISNGKRISLS